MAGETPATGLRLYIGPDDIPVSTVRAGQTDTDIIRMIDEADNADFSDRKFQGTAAISTGFHPDIKDNLGKPVIEMGWNTPNMETEGIATNFYKNLLPTIDSRLSKNSVYLDVLRYDAIKGGRSYTNLLQFSAGKLSKFETARKPCSHAEVLVVDKIIKKLTLEYANIGRKVTDADIAKIKVFVKRKNGGSFCRCPNCFHILNNLVQMIGNP